MFGLALMGYVAARVGWFSDEAAGGLARFVFDFAVPLLLVRVFAHAELPGAVPWPLLVSFYLPAAALYGLGMLVSGRLFRRGLGEQTMTGFSSSFGNSVLLGLPLALMTFDQDGMIPYFILLSVHGLVYFTVSTALLEYARQRDRPSSSLPAGVARGLVTNPIMLGLVAGVTLNLTGLTLPGPIDRTLEHMQLAVTPCALFSLGASLTRCRISGRLQEPLLVVAAKNLLMPALVWLVAGPLLGLPASWSQAALLLAAQPTGINVYLFAVRYGTARELTTTTVFLSTAASLVSVTAVLYLLQTME